MACVCLEPGLCVSPAGCRICCFPEYLFKNASTQVVCGACKNLLVYGRNNLPWHPNDSGFVRFMDSSVLELLGSVDSKFCEAPQTCDTPVTDSTSSHVI